MKVDKGLFVGGYCFGDEAERLFNLYKVDGYEYVAVDTSHNGVLNGFIRMEGVSAHFDVTFETMEEAVEALRSVKSADKEPQA